MKKWGKGSWFDKLTMSGMLALILLSVVSCKGEGQSKTEKGKILYLAHCASCHGEKGNGQGPVAKYLWPKPRNLTSGITKYKTTRGPVPSDYDILKTLKIGIPGTSMPGWDVLPDNDWESILTHIKTFSPETFKGHPGPRIDIPQEKPDTPESVTAGEKLFASIGCVGCHGPTGKGDGPASSSLSDAWGDRVAPRDFTAGPLRWGNAPADIFRTLSSGVAGTPMPAYEQTLTADQRWDLTHYIKSLQHWPRPENDDPSNPKRFLISVGKFSGKLPGDPLDPTWDKVVAVPVFLKPLWNDPKNPEWLTVKALANENEIAFDLSWEDANANILATATDSVALQFPIHTISDPAKLPYVGMGHPDNPVHIWRWETSGTTESNASGPNTLILQSPAQTQAKGQGVYQDGKWHVAIKRPLKTGETTDTRIGRTGYLSFAVWNADLQRYPIPTAFSEWMIYELKD